MNPNFINIFKFGEKTTFESKVLSLNNKVINSQSLYCVLEQSLFAINFFSNVSPSVGAIHFGNM